MVYELLRSFVQKIFQDKILAGLVIVGILAIFVGGFGGESSEKVASGPREARKTSTKGEEKSIAASKQKESQAKAKGASAASAPEAQAPLEPALAVQFVSWWIGSGLDFNPHTAVQNRQQAAAWVSPETLPSYQAAFWPPEVAEGISSGRIHGSFTAASVQPLAANPDGSVVVNVKGNLLLQQGSKPAIQQLSTDYLVRRETGGLRIAGLYNRAVRVPGSSVY